MTIEAYYNAQLFYIFTFKYQTNGFHFYNLEIQPLYVFINIKINKVYENSRDIKINLYI